MAVKRTGECPVCGKRVSVSKFGGTALHRVPGQNGRTEACKGHQQKANNIEEKSIPWTAR